MKRKYFIAAAAVLVLAAIIVVMVTLQAGAPKPITPTQPYKEGDKVSVEGSSVCLEHTDKDGPQTMECAYGLKTDDGTVYALRDTTDDYSLVMKISSAKKVRTEGIYHKSNDSKYDQSGTIEVTGVETLE